MSRIPELPRSVAAVAAEYLEKEIIEGRLEPGQRLIEEIWAERFGISRGSFREVLRILEVAKLVEILPRRGAQVATLNRKDVEEIYLLRKHLFEVGFNYAANRMTDESLAKLREIFAGMETAVKQGDVVEFSRLSWNFDEIVFEVAGISRLKQVIEFLGKQTLRYRYIGSSLPGRIEQSLEGHRHIIEAFAARDGVSAGRKVYEVVETAGRSIISNIFQDAPEQPDDKSASADSGARSTGT